jgi:hypothetical protein
MFLPFPALTCRAKGLASAGGGLEIFFRSFTPPRSIHHGGQVGVPGLSPTGDFRPPCGGLAHLIIRALADLE